MAELMVWLLVSNIKYSKCVRIQLNLLFFLILSNSFFVSHVIQIANNVLYYNHVILIKLFLSLSSPPVFEFRNCVSPETTAHRHIGSGQHEYINVCK